jgi:acetylornithine deacetylase
MSEHLIRDIKNGINEDQLMELALRLVQRPSQQTDKLEYDPEVKSFISDVLVKELKSKGVNNVTLDEMGNLICRVGKPESKKKVFFLGYAMTHPASSMSDPFKGEIITENDRKAIRGRGISEQKGSLAAMIYAVDFINQYNLDNPIDGELIFGVSLAGETGRHLSIDSINKSIGLEADFGIVGIGTNSKICQGNKGRVDVLVNVYGKSCHSSTPLEGINAIEGACEVIKRLQGFEITSSHPKLGKATLTSTSIKSFPDATHTIQNECRLVFDRRLLPGDNPADVIAEISTAIGDIPPYRIEVVEGPVTYPSEVEDDSIIIDKLTDSIESMCDDKAKTFYSNSAIDAGYLNKINIPAVMYGPGDMKQWHTDNEILYIDDLLKGAFVYTYAALNHLK